MVVDPRASVFEGAGVANHQHLPALFDTVQMTFGVALVHAFGMPVQVAIGMTLMPGRHVLSLNARQAFAHRSRDQAFEKRQALGGGQVRW
jgi:hypothetical protein